MLLNFVADGGFVMVPLLLLGFALTGVAALQALRPVEARWPLIRSLGALLSLTGVLGFVLAVVSVLRGATSMPGEHATILLAGLAEAANNLTLTLVFLVIASLGWTIGAARQKAPEAARG